MRPSEWDALRAEDEQDYRDRTGPYAPAGQPTYPQPDHPDLIDLDTGDEYQWVGEGYAHEGDHDFVWSRDDLVKTGDRLVETASLDPAHLAELRQRYAAGD